jgi:hypothetical protein
MPAQKSSARNTVSKVDDTEISKEFYKLCWNCELEKAKEMYKKNTTIAITSINNNTFRIMCDEGKFEIVKWFYQIAQENNIYIDYENVFNLLCDNNRLEIAQWLYQMNPDSIDISKNNEYTFRMVCKSANLNIAKWLLQVKPDINISAQNDEAFKNASSHYTDNFEVAKWLLLIKPEILNTFDFEENFYIACLDHKINLAKWYIQLNPNLNIHDISFTYACRFGSNTYTEIAMWLHSIRPYHFILVTEKKRKEYKIVNYGVRPLKERKWEERKLILASHLKGKTHNLLYDLPLDLVRNICAFV